MTFVVGVIARALGLGLVLTCYLLLIPVIWPPGDVPDANIGAGLLGFLLLAMSAFGWALVDGRRGDFARTSTCWAVVACVLSVGWLAVRTLLETGSASAALSLALADAGTLPFTVALLLVPAVAGAGIGVGLRDSGRAAGTR